METFRRVTWQALQKKTLENDMKEKVMAKFEFSVFLVKESANTKKYAGYI